jgi:phage recombination protein Bet
MTETNQIVKQEEKLSVINAMAEKYGMEKPAFEAVIKNTVMPGNVKQEEFVSFLSVAKEYDLNPLIKEIYAFPSKGGIQPIVSIDGWCRIINEHPQLNGIEFKDNIIDGKVDSIECIIHRKDREKPITATEYMEECQRNTDPWKKWPRRMLRHKALIQCARYAFGFSGIYDKDEAERIGESINSQGYKNVTPDQNQPSQVDLKEFLD